VAAAI